ncbi:MAG: uracil phosphoribosyltransferase [Planctomycetota bacterium]|nr:MAG: uracil phosphoribosyltransferase [Planctomycetota bacterium]
MVELAVSKHPLVAHKISLLRAVETEPAQFRRLVGQLAVLLGFEACRDLPLKSQPIRTPMTETQGVRLQGRLALVPILRAGLGMVHALHELLPHAEVWHLGMARNETSLEPVQYYPLPQGRQAERCLVLDPMLATGGSAIAAIHRIKERGVPTIKFVGLLGAPEGVEALQKAHPDVPVLLGALDERLNQKGYILPGLGDAGDRQFGTV